MTRSTYLSSIETADNIKKIVRTALENQALAAAEVESILQNLSDIAESDQEHIVRGMELPVEHCAAGLSLLAFFPRLLALQHPTYQVKSIIEQKKINHEKEHVKFILEVEPGHRQVIEAMLEQYSLALLKKVPLNVLAKDEWQLAEFKKALDLSVLQISLNASLDVSDLAQTSDNMESCARDVGRLHMLVGQGLGNMKDLQTIIALLLAEEQEAISKALLVLRERLNSRMTAEDEREVKEALRVVQEHAPDAFEEIRQVINKSSDSGAAGDMLYSWIASLSGILPK